MVSDREKKKVKGTYRKKKRKKERKRERENWF